MNFTGVTEKGFFEHLWASAHVVLAHLPIALLSIAFMFTVLGYIGRQARRFNLGIIDKLKLQRFYDHVWPLQIIGTIFIYPTMLFGERDYDSLGSQKLQDLAERHEGIGELTTHFYLLVLFALSVGVVNFKHKNNQLSKGSFLSRASIKKDVFMKENKAAQFICRIENRLFDTKSHPIHTFAWLVISFVGFALLSYTGYLGGELVHEHGILAN